MRRMGTSGGIRPGWAPAFCVFPSKRHLGSFQRFARYRQRRAMGKAKRANSSGKLTPSAPYSFGARGPPRTPRPVMRRFGKLAPPAVSVQRRLDLAPPRSKRCAATLALGTVAVESQRAQDGSVHIWLDPGDLTKLKALRGPGESYSDV